MQLPYLPSDNDRATLANDTDVYRSTLGGMRAFLAAGPGIKCSRLPYGNKKIAESRSRVKAGICRS